MAESESSELLDVSSYEGGNMLNSEIFRTRDIRWISANLDMREGKAFGHQPYLERGPSKFGFHVPSVEEREEVSDIIEELGLSEKIHEILFLPKAGKKTGLDTDVDVGEEGYYLTRIPNADGTANVFHPSAEGNEILQMAIKNAISVRGFRNNPIVPTTEWRKLSPGGGLRLPLEYQEVEYIESTGTQWIDTGYKTNNKISTRMQIQENMSYINSNAIFGDAWSENALFLMAYNGYFRYHYSFSGQNVASITADKTIIETSPTGIKINGTSYSYNVGSTFSSNNIWIFHSGDNANTNMRGRFKLYGFKLYDDGVLVRDFVPCYRRIDGAIGMYDLVNDQFYANAGTGVFLKGADVNTPQLPEGYTEVEYLQSNGSQYIDTLIDRNEILTPFIRYDFYSDTSTADCGFLGYWGTGGYIFGESSNQYRFTAGGTNGWTNSGISYSTGRHVFTTNASNWYLDGVQGAGNGGNMTIYTGTLHLFRAGGGFTVPSGNVRVYSCLVGSSNDNLIHYYIPCFRNSDSKPGLYDLITKEFLVNGGTGEFTLGRPISYRINSNTLSYFPLYDSAVDVTGNRTLTLSGATISGGALNINASGNYTKLNTGIGGSIMTASLFYYYQAVNTTAKWNSLLVRGNGDYHHLLISAGDSIAPVISVPGFYNKDAGNTKWYPGSKAIQTGKWYHLVVVKNGVNEKIYCNGELLIDSNASFDNNTYPITIIGSHSDTGGGQGALGKISECIFEDRAWSEEDITNYLNTMKDRYNIE